MLLFIPSGSLTAHAVPFPGGAAGDVFSTQLDNLAAASGGTMHAVSGGTVDPFVFEFSIFVLAVFVGYFVVWSVTPALHTPLMSVTNAVSSVIIVGALLAAAAPVAPGAHTVWIYKGAGAVAAGLASVNIFGGFLVTQRMLAMYRKKERGK